MIKKESKNAVRLRKHARVREKIFGTASLPRVSVFRSNKHIECQAIDDVNGVTLAHSSSVMLHLENGSNQEAAKKVSSPSNMPKPGPVMTAVNKMNTKIGSVKKVGSSSMIGTTKRTKRK